MMSSTAKTQKDDSPVAMMFSLDALRFDEVYQNPVPPDSVRKLAGGGFARFRAPTRPNRRADGSRWARVARRRTEAKRLRRDNNMMAPGENPKIYGMLYRGLSITEEAEFYYRSSSPDAVRRKSAYELYRGRLGMQEPTATLIDRLAQDTGWEIGDKTTKPGILVCVGSIDQALARYGEDAVRDALSVAHSAGFPRLPGLVVKGMAAAMLAHAGQFKHAHVVSALSKYSAEDIANAARKTNVTKATPGPVSAYAVIVEIYNYGLREEARIEALSPAKFFKLRSKGSD